MEARETDTIARVSIFVPQVIKGQHTHENPDSLASFLVGYHLFAKVQEILVDFDSSHRELFAISPL
jgi:hypothetical protein